MAVPSALTRSLSASIRHGAAPCNKLYRYHVPDFLAKFSGLRQPRTPPQFYTSPSTWASSLGFNSGSISEWITTSHTSKDATVSNACDPLLGYPQVAVHLRKWAYASHRGRLDKIPPLRFIAKNAASYDLRVVNSDFLSHRKESFRELSISKWAMVIRPAMKVSQDFSASWYNPPDGPPRRPATADEACKGALQEWSKLMTEPLRKLSNPLITQYNDEFGRPRGTINFEVACNAPPDSNIRLVAQRTWARPILNIPLRTGLSPPRSNG